MFGAMTDNQNNSMFNNNNFGSNNNVNPNTNFLTGFQSNNITGTQPQMTAASFNPGMLKPRKWN